MLQKYSLPVSRLVSNVSQCITVTQVPRLTGSISTCACITAGTSKGEHSKPHTDSESSCLRLTQDIAIPIPLARSHPAAAAVKSLQLCPTLCDPIDGGPPGSPVPGILQARTLEWFVIFLSHLRTTLKSTGGVYNHPKTG